MKNSNQKQKNSAVGRVVAESGFLFQMIENSLVATCIFDQAGECIAVNSAFCDIFAINENILTSSGYNLFHDKKLTDGEVFSDIKEILRYKKTREWYMQEAFGVIGGAATGGPQMISPGKLKVSGIPILDEQGEVAFIVIQYQPVMVPKFTDEYQRLHQFRDTIRGVSNVWVNQTDEETNITFWNKAAELISGYSGEEAIGHRDIWTWLYPDELYRLQIIEKIKSVFRGDELKDFESSITCRDGTIKTISWYTRSLKDSRGKSTGLISFGLDISNRKQAEDELKEQEERYKSFYNNALVGLFSSRISDGTFLEINTKAAQLLELPRDKIVGKLRTLDLYRNPKQRQKLVEALEKHGKAHSFETDMILPNGKEVIFEISVKAYPESDYMEGAVIDITEKMQAENALRESEEKYRNVVQNAQEAICVIQDGFFRYFNPQALKLFGYTNDELSKLPIEESIYLPDRGMVAEHRILREKGGDALDVYSHRIVTKKGVIRWVDIKPVTISWNRKDAILVFLTDVTERKRSEALMIQTEKIMSIGGLAAGMAHELNNPIGGMLMGVQNVMRRLSQDLAPNQTAAVKAGIDLNNLQVYLENRKILSFLQGIQEAGKKASKIITSMLQFSRKSESQKKPANLSNLVDSVLDLVNKDFDLNKGYDFRMINITKEIDPDLPLVPCSETEIEQVFLNLFRNAAQAMNQMKPEESQRIIIRIAMEANQVRIEIEDNGPGMEEPVRKRIFEPFFTTKPTGKGTGIGLSVSYMIITGFHNGTMEVDSSPGRGTRFIIRLPIIPVKPES